MTEKKHEKIRVLSGTPTGNCIAVGESEKNIQIWDINKGFIRTLSTDLVSGMSRAISISENGKQLCVAGYDNKSVTLYNIETGKVIWKRDDIRRPSTSIILNHTDNLVYLDTENKGSFFLDGETGDSIEKPRGVESIIESPYSNIDQYIKLSTSNLVDRINKKTIKSITHKSFAILDSTFSDSFIACSYSGNPLEVISLKDFSVIWSINVVGHFLNIEYSKELNQILGIRWDYEKGGSKFLSYINVENGKIEREIDLGEPIELEFLRHGSLLITSQGQLYSTESGEVIKEFDFENK